MRKQVTVMALGLLLSEPALARVTELSWVDKAVQGTKKGLDKAAEGAKKGAEKTKEGAEKGADKTKKAVDKATK